MTVEFQFPLLVVVGLSCSGKSVFMNAPFEKSIICIDWGQCIKENLPIGHRSNRIEYLEYLRDCARELGHKYFVNVVLCRLREIAGQSENSYGVIVSGGRHPEEVEDLISYFPRSLVVAVFADYRMRFQRCIQRKRAGDPDTIEDFVRNDMLEYLTGLAEISYRIADRIIFNDDDLEDFRIKVKRLFVHFFK